MTRIRRAGGRWRLLVHDYLGRGQYGKAHHIQSHPDPTDEEREKLRGEWFTETVFEGTEFDELVVGRWIHVEQMGTGYWWMSVGGVVLHVWVDRDGRPTAMTVHGPGAYEEPVKGCTYECVWGEP